MSATQLKKARWLQSVAYAFLVACAQGAQGQAGQKLRINTSNLENAHDGSYVRAEFVDRKSKTYSTAKFWDAPPIFSDIEIHLIKGGVRLFAGNLHEGLLSFAINQKGVVDPGLCSKTDFCAGSPCYEKHCISAIGVESQHSFWIEMNGQRQHFVSTADLKEVELPEPRE